MEVKFFKCMKNKLEIGLYTGLTLGIIGLISSLKINHPLEPFHLIKIFAMLNKIEPFPSGIFCTTHTMTCFDSIIRGYTFVFEFIIGFIIVLLIGLFIRRNNKISP